MSIFPLYSQSNETATLQPHRARLRLTPRALPIHPFVPSISMSRKSRSMIFAVVLLQQSGPYGKR